MSDQRPDESSQPPVSGTPSRPENRPDSAVAGNRVVSYTPVPTQDPPVAHSEPAPAPQGKPVADSPLKKDVTVLVRGETVADPDPKSAPNDAQPKDKPKSAPKAVSEAKLKRQSRLPALEDDADIGTPKEQVVTRDGKPDFAFSGTLLASAAPSTAPRGKWSEYRVYETSAGKHIFSKVTRTVFAEEQDTHEAEVFDPAPSSVPSQLLRTARDLTRSHPLTWTDAAAHFFGYDPLAKALYRKLTGKFEEHIS